MKKILVALSIICVCAVVNAQSKYLTKTGYVGFYSKTALEEIKAENNQVASIMDTESGEIIITVLMKSFKFERALMEEHFNENYVESDKFPKSSFKGKITNLSAIDFKKEGTYKAEIEGEMTIHGVTKSVKTTGTVEVKGDQINAKSKFLLNPVDYNIEIPSVVREKISENLDISVNFDYTLMKK